MTASDRAFRALARSQPNVIGTFLRAVASPSLIGSTELTSEDVAATQIDALPPPLDVDWVARRSGGELLHVECQGYRDPDFVERLFWYHLRLSLLHRPRLVRSIAIWVTRPKRSQRVEAHQHGDIVVRMTTIVLEDVDAARLLEHPDIACFAPGANAGGWSDEELCQRAAGVMAGAGASYYQRHMAVVAAATRGRYDQMVKAMSDHDMEPVIIEDLVKFGEDRGWEKGREKGREEGREEILVIALEQRLARPLTAAERTLLGTRLASGSYAEVMRTALTLEPSALSAWFAG